MMSRNLRACIWMGLLLIVPSLLGLGQERQSTVVVPSSVVGDSIGTDSSTLVLKYPVRDFPFLNLYPWRTSRVSLGQPSNIRREIVFDPATRQYVIREKLGATLYRPPQYLSFDEYQRYENELLLRRGWEGFSNQTLNQYRTDRIIPTIYVESEAFERIFGSNRIDIIPRGTADITLRGQRHENANPMFNERQRKQWGFDFDQRIQMNLTGQIGERLRLTTNYNTQAQFDFENQIRLDYIGGDDDIIRRIEVGNVSMPLNTTLITGTESLFGIKTQLQFGRLHLTGIFSQQKSRQREIMIRNGAQESQFTFKADAYEDNQHYFLAHYFRENFNRALEFAPLISTNINITQIEVWLSNRSNAVDDSRDVLALMDLGEQHPRNSGITPGTSALPSTGIPGMVSPSSNNLLELLPEDARNTNSNAVRDFFAGLDPSIAPTDNFAKTTYARKLREGTDYTVNRRLGFISLRMPLRGDQVLSVAYRYTADGREYQVGELSTDRPVTPSQPTMLYTKMLKNEVLKTELPTWDLMMKNIYSIGAYNVGPSNFQFQIYRLDDETGVERPVIFEGVNTENKLWIQLTGLDRLNPQQARQPDGVFDFLPGLTIEPDVGRVMFPVLEPFGADLKRHFDDATEEALIEKYTFPELYETTRTLAQQLYPNKNRYLVKGSYQSEAGTEFQLGAINVPHGSVQVFAGNSPLREGEDFLVDYNIGRVRILNQALLHSGQPIRIKMEDSQLFGMQQRTMMGGRLDFVANDRLQLGGTVMRLSERPLTQKVMVGEEPISNTMWGFDLNYNTPSRWLTRMVDKIPFIDTKEDSYFSFYGEFAQLNPGSPRALNFAGSRNGTTYIDDFENTRSFIDLKGATGWQISGTPQFFDESHLTDSLEYGFNRAHLAFYNIDPIFYRNSASLTPSNIDNAELSKHRVREVLEQEVFPFKEPSTGLPMYLPTLDLAFYPKIRGPYNYNANPEDIDPLTGELLHPETRWGGIFRKIDAPDFESQNIEFIEIWMMDPFLTNPGSSGGELYFNLGNISEDILKDGRKALENGMPTTGDLSGVEETAWGRVPKRQPVVQAFDNDPSKRALQDIGIDGLSDADERSFHADFLDQMRMILSPEAFSVLENDPSRDNFQYYRGRHMDAVNAGILQRYKHINGMEGNSRTPEQSIADFGVETSAVTLLPDGEDISRDNNMNEVDAYFQYKISLDSSKMNVGENYIADYHDANVRLPNGRTEKVRWYQFRIPLSEYEEAVGDIEDFRSIRFMRMFMTGFADTTVLRMAQLQLVRGEWRRYNAENEADKVIMDPDLATSISGPDQSSFLVSTVNIEENGDRRPIPYVVPPGIDRQLDWGTMNTGVQLNEQSLSLEVRNLSPGHGRAAFRTTVNDFRPYGRLQMFIHAEGLLQGAPDNTPLRDGDLDAFIRLGTDDRYNYYEYIMPLQVTSGETQDPDQIWPESNRMDIALALFQQVREARRTSSQANGAAWPLDEPFVLHLDGGHRVVIKGQPDLSNVQFYMLGVLNALPENNTPRSGIVWFNELRLTDFDRKGGWAATARMQMRLADFADITVSGRKSTIGFGSLDQRIGARNRSEDLYFDMVANAEFGKFFKADHGIRIPFYFSYTNQLSTPEYNPLIPDVKLADLTRQQRNDLLEEVQQYMTRRSFSFTNVRKIRTNIERPIRPWNIENWSLTYSFAEQFQRDHVTQSALQQQYRGVLDYSFASPGQRFIEPFKKVLKNDHLALLRDFNFNLMPSLLHFRVDVNRIYNENNLRQNNSPDNFLPGLGALDPMFNKSFTMNRIYGISWNLSRSLKLDFNATNYAIIDEPEGRMDGLKRDTLWENFWRLGRTTDYNHMLNVTYTLPMDRIPGLDWVNVDTRYGAQFTWQAEPLFSQLDSRLDLGNSIQNARTIQVNPRLALTGLYNKVGFIRNRTGPAGGGGILPFLLNLLTSVKDINGAYTRVENTLLPGYKPETDVFGYDFRLDAPGIGFLFGSQQDIRDRAAAGRWITRDTMQNQLYMTSLTEDISFRALTEPIRGLQAEFSAIRLNNRNYTANLRYTETNVLESSTPFTNGTFNISYHSLGTSFANHNSLFARFEENRKRVSQRLGELNPNSSGPSEKDPAFADGYDKDAQDVVVQAFLATYGRADIDKPTLSPFPRIPIPGWRLSYSGLGNLPLFKGFITSITINHGYDSKYAINGYQSPAGFRQEQHGPPSQRDGNGNFLPEFQFQQVSIFEQFAPLLGMDIRFRNGLTTNAEFRRARTLSLSLQNSQLAMLSDQSVVVGLGYRATGFQMPFGWFEGRRLENDLNFRMDFALNDLKTTVYRAEVDVAEISAGNRSISVRPSVDYMINQRFQVRLFFDSNAVRPYTSQTFATSYANFGFTLRVMFQ